MDKNKHFLASNINSPVSCSHHGGGGEEEAERADQDPQTAGWSFHRTSIQNI